MLAFQGVSLVVNIRRLNRPGAVAIIDQGEPSSKVNSMWPVSEKSTTVGLRSEFCRLGGTFLIGEIRVLTVMQHSLGREGLRSGCAPGNFGTFLPPPLLRDNPVYHAGDNHVQGH